MSDTDDDKLKQRIIHKRNEGGGGGDRYRTHVRWLRDSHFLRDLERDNIDSDVIDEELDTLRTDDTPMTKRERLVKFLRSHPVQTFLCAIVLMDASIVIAQILLDINSVKDQLAQRDNDLNRLLAHLQHTNDQQQLGQYIGRNDVIIDTSQSVEVSPLEDSSNCTRTSSSCRPDEEDEANRMLNGDNRDENIDVTLGDKTMTSSRESSRDNDVIISQPMHVDVFRTVAHSLHYISIAILGFLLFEDVIRIAALGQYICRHKIEILDAVVIATSFVVDIVFVGGVTGDHGQKAAAALFVLLVWRVARVVDGIIMTVKQRQEFRIRLQRRARRKAEKQVDAAETERHQRQRELQALQDLCLRAGVKPENIEAVCSNGKSPKRISRMLQAFSSVARLSFGMTLPYSRPSSVCSSRRQSHISRHPSDGFLQSSRRASLAITTSLVQRHRHQQHITNTDDDETLSLQDHDVIGGPTAAAIATRSPPRERSNSDATTYYLRRLCTSPLSGRLGPGASSGSGRVIGYRRAVLDGLLGRIIVVQQDSEMESSLSSQDSIGITVVCDDERNTGQGHSRGQERDQGQGQRDGDRCSDCSSSSEVKMMSESVTMIDTERRDSVGFSSVAAATSEQTEIQQQEMSDDRSETIGSYRIICV